jgi:enoyl-CoA hydratase
MLRVEHDGAIATWTLDRPEAKNALASGLIDALLRALDDARNDRSLRVVILTGAGDAFASGGDLRELHGKTTEAEATRFAAAGEAICQRLGELDVPVIAALSGVAFGGGAELACACDLRIADETARISFKQVRMGITTAWGTIPRLVSIVGHGSAARLLYTAHEVTAEEARAIGLVDHVCARGTAPAIARAWALDIVAGSGRAVAEMKAILRASRTASPAAIAKDERARFVATWSGADHAEAMDAYFARRPPKWTDA